MGAFGRNHARVYHQLAQQGEPVTLAAVVDPDVSRADAIAREYRARAFGSVEQFIKTRSEVQAASVAVPTAQHVELAGALMAGGIDVLIEKPLAASLAEADDLMRSARRLGRLSPAAIPSVATRALSLRRRLRCGGRIGPAGESSTAQTRRA